MIFFFRYVSQDYILLRDVFHGVFSVDNKVIIGALQKMRDTFKAIHA